MSSDSPENTGLQIQRESGLAKLPNNESSALTEIINRSLVHIQTSKVLAVRHRVGEYELCGPDYKLVCALAEDLGYSPERVLIQLMDTSSYQEGYNTDGTLAWRVDCYDTWFCDEIQNESPSIIVDGRFKSLLVMGDKLPITSIPSIDGLSINRVTLHNCYHLGENSLDINLQYFLDLEEFSCRSVNLKNLELEHLPKLRKLICNDSNLMELNLSKVPNLKILDCGNNQLENLDVSPVPGLVELRCSGNKLTKLDLSPVPNLIALHCSGNELTALNLSVVPHLTELYCSENYIRKLDFSRLINLNPYKSYGIEDKYGKLPRIIRNRKNDKAL